MPIVIQKYNKINIRQYANMRIENLFNNKLQ